MCLPPKQNISPLRSPLRSLFLPAQDDELNLPAMLKIPVCRLLRELCPLIAVANEAQLEKRAGPIPWYAPGQNDDDNDATYASPIKRRTFFLEAQSVLYRAFSVDSFFRAVKDYA